MSKHRIAIAGCDDTTYLDLELSPSELAFVRRLEEASDEASKVSCQPIIYIVERDT